ncbi:MAG TPA: response regulator [Bryobacteraceae bacterium]|nr:response regulator [Bryobacteraceae bacterium]
MAKVLLADDNEFRRDMLACRLVRHGYEVITAANGGAALAAARGQRPDLILLDIDMPVMEGGAAMRSLKNDPRTFRIPVIALAAEASLEKVTQAAAEGCQACEAKPVVMGRLLERIEEVLAAKKTKKNRAAAEGQSFRR